MGIWQEIHEWLIPLFPIILITEFIVHFKLKARKADNVKFWKSNKHLDMSIYEDDFWKISLLQAIIWSWTMLEHFEYIPKGFERIWLVVLIFYILGLSYVGRALKVILHNKSLNSDG